MCFYREEATTASSTFFLRQEKDDQKIILEDKDLEVIGAPIIKYGDSTVLVQHSDTGLWLTYKVRTLSYSIFFKFLIVNDIKIIIKSTQVHLKYDYLYLV